MNCYNDTCWRYEGHTPICCPANDCNMAMHYDLYEQEERDVERAIATLSKYSRLTPETLDKIGCVEFEVPSDDGVFTLVFTHTPGKEKLGSVSYSFDGESVEFVYTEMKIKV